MSLDGFQAYLSRWTAAQWNSKSLPLHFDHRSDFFRAIELLWSSQNYSLIDGGKRFRPQLVFAVSESLNLPVERFYPWAAAIEMVHTYSLIHDDLPSMDNDDLRRGKATNHKVYGEAAALLAGDSLLTEAFGVIANEYRHQPAMAIQLIHILSEAAGSRGMVGGQAWDLFSQIQFEKNELLELHYFKTGALIRASIEGAALVSNLSEEDSACLKSFGEHLGLAFQIQDDILDFETEAEDQKNLAQILGKQQAQNLLSEISLRAEKDIDQLKRSGISEWSRLSDLIHKNQFRKN
jgi:geranylgeranyl diphosphate synthase type II